MLTNISESCIKIIWYCIGNLPTLECVSGREESDVVVVSLLTGNGVVVADLVMRQPGAISKSVTCTHLYKIVTLFSSILGRIQAHILIE